jgi:hypothetical protein
MGRTFEHLAHFVWFANFGLQSTTWEYYRFIAYFGLGGGGIFVPVMLVAGRLVSTILSWVETGKTPASTLCSGLKQSIMSWLLARSENFLKANYAASLPFMQANAAAVTTRTQTECHSAVFLRFAQTNCCNLSYMWLF